MPYLLYVNDNFHYMDEDERYLTGTFETADAALAEARRIVDQFLIHAHKPGMSARDLYETYTGFGEDPFIVSTYASVPVMFSAWKYAEERCDVICGEAEKDR